MLESKTPTTFKIESERRFAGDYNDQLHRAICRNCEESPPASALESSGGGVKGDGITVSLQRARG